MKLFGSYRSPFVRRVAITMNEFGMPFEHMDVPVFDNPDAVNVHNPLTRVPTLVLDDGEVLMWSLNEGGDLPPPAWPSPAGPRVGYVPDCTGQSHLAWALLEIRFVCIPIPATPP